MGGQGSGGWNRGMKPEEWFGEDEYRENNKKHSEFMKEWHKNNVHPNKGRKMPKELKERLMKINSHPFSEEHKNKIRAALKKVWKNPESTFNSELYRKKIGENTKRFAKEHPEHYVMMGIKGTISCSRRNPTSIEKIMMAALQQAGIPFTFQKWIGYGFVYDFGLGGQNILIECDGEYWHSRPENKDRDRKKDEYAREKGFKLLRFTGTQIKEDIGGCIDGVKRCF
jgi:very-short-patch-repair endonuclease